MAWASLRVGELGTVVERAQLSGATDRVEGIIAEVKKKVFNNLNKYLIPTYLLMT